MAKPEIETWPKLIVPLQTDLAVGPIGQGAAPSVTT